MTLGNLQCKDMGLLHLQQVRDRIDYYENVVSFRFLPPLSHALGTAHCIDTIYFIYFFNLCQTRHEHTQFIQCQNGHYSTYMYYFRFESMMDDFP